MLKRKLRTFVWLPTLIGFAAMSAWSDAQAPTGVAQAPSDPFASQTTGGNEAQGVITIDADSFVIAFRKDSNVFLGYSAEDGSWDRYEFAEKVVAVPLLSGGHSFGIGGRRVAGAFRLSGDAIDELVAVDWQGKFRTAKLERPASGKLTPLADGSMVLYVVDDRVYAFSAKTGTWDSLIVPEEAGVEILTEGAVSLSGLTFTGEKAIYHAKNGCSIFSVDSGKWTSASFEADVP
ncbi:MAG TPA: hypothetical protein VGN57_14370 [Pirellulaceae bacterium]|jgi:hypothetical protein|nr:hypothetical protein [Pirellulaceae bacterium]